MNYTALAERLFSYAGIGKMKQCLSNMQRIDEWLGAPHRKFESIHVAGTNGKGSVSLKIAAALQHAGKRVGLYTSPHISTFRERIQIDGQLIPKAFILDFLPRLFAFIDRADLRPTFFELLTALAFAYFAEEKIEIAVLEVGLGGRLDATNVVAPLLSIITSIEEDHTDILGRTLHEIAREKAGIVKPGIPAVIGPRAHFAPILSLASQTKMIFAPPAAGFYDFENSAIARSTLEVLKLPEESIAAGLKQRPPCRFEIVGERPVILDVAHNVDGFAHLFEALQLFYPGVRFKLLLSLGKGKDACRFVEKIAPALSRIACFSNGHSRLVSAEELASQLRAGGFAATAAPSIEEALTSCEPTLVCGSFFAMADVRAALGFKEEIDSFLLSPQRRLQ